MTLFSCNGPDEMIMGDIGPVENYAPDSNSHQENFDRIEMEGSFMNYGSANDSDKDSTKNIIQQDRDNIKGKVSYNYNEVENQQEEPQEEIKTACTINEEEYIKGDYAYTPPDTIKTEPIVLDTVEEIFVLGEMVYREPLPVEIFTPIDTTQTKTTIIEEVPVEPNGVVISESSFSVKLFPNPTTDVALVVVEIKQASHFTLELFDINGQKLARIYDGRLSPGQQQFAVAMHTYAPGTYMLIVTEANSVQTVKIQKVN